MAEHYILRIYIEDSMNITKDLEGKEVWLRALRNFTRNEYPHFPVKIVKVNRVNVIIETLGKYAKRDTYRYEGGRLSQGDYSYYDVYSSKEEVDKEILHENLVSKLHYLVRDGKHKKLSLEDLQDIIGKIGE